MAVRFGTNVPLTLCFPYGDFMPVQGQYGEQFLYTIELDGQRDKLYATPLLHQELQAAGVEAGGILTITKVEAEGNRKSWIVQSAGGNGTQRYCQMLWMARERIRRFQAASFISPSMNGTPSMTWVMSL